MTNIFFSANTRTEKDENTIQLLGNTKKSISFLSCVVISVNSYIGYSLCTFARHMQAGLLIVYGIHALVFAMIYYSSYIALMLMKDLRAFSYVEEWKTSNFKCSGFISASIIVTVISFISYYVKNVKIMLNSIHSRIFPSSPNIIYDTYLVWFVMVAIFLLPSCIGSITKYNVVISYIGVVLTLVVMIFSIRWGVESIVTRGFDPDHQISIVNTSYSFISCFKDYTAAYVNFVFLFLGTTDVINLTFDRSKKLLLTSMGTFATIIVIISTFQYFYVYDKFESGENYLTYIPTSDPTLLLAYICVILKLFTTIPIFSSTAASSLLETISTQRSYPRPIWAGTEIILTLVAVFYGSMTNTFTNVIYAMINVVGMTTQFIVPPVMLIKQMGHHSKWHWLGIAAMILLGLVFDVAVLISFL